MSAESEASLLQRLTQFADLGAALAVVGIVLMLILPLPAGVLDALLMCNLCVSLLTILMAMQIREPLEFSVFPTLLLVTTLFRLGLDVSATRMILLHGDVKDPVSHVPTGAGHLIPAFGQVVVGGNLVVGGIMFAILILIQILVIGKGADRIAGIAARFCLEQMPHKNMAIDHDLQTGALTQEQATLKRAKVEQESDFFGSMDGAGKFIQGDAMAAVAIMLVNVFGGLLIGVGYHHMTAWDALNTFALLSMGNGLLTALPAFLMSTAMGLIVSRAAAKSKFGNVLAQQILAQPTVLGLGSIFMGCMFVLSLAGAIAFPSHICFVLSAVLALVARQLRNDQAQAAEATAVQIEEKQKEEKKTPHPEKSILNLQLDPLSLEVGRGLLPLVDPGQGAKLLERVTSIRRHIANELGLIVPGVRFRDNLQLQPQTYVIKVKEQEVARGTVQVQQFLAIGPEDKLKSLRGQKVTDPTYQMPGVWIPPEERASAERLGCMIFDPVSVVATQLTEMIRNYAADLLGHQDAQSLLDNLRKTHPAVVKNLVPDQLSLAEVCKILQNLLRERVPIRDTVTILETLIENVGTVRDLELLTELVRMALARTICREYSNNEATLVTMSLDPELDLTIQNAIYRKERGSALHLPPHVLQELLTAVGDGIRSFETKGLQPILLTTGEVRSTMRRLTQRTYPQLVVLSWNEIAPKFNVNAILMVSV